jgi:hypothetical protein
MQLAKTLTVHPGKFAHMVAVRIKVLILHIDLAKLGALAKDPIKANS